MPHAHVSGGLPDLERGIGRSPLLDTLASQALAQVADRFRASRADPDGSALERLYCAAIGADPRACAEVARALIADGLPAEQICDHHIPATARRMGEDWVSDDLTFTAVTIGTARLQGLLRELDRLLERGVGPAAGGGTVLVVVAPGADHTLGALVLASQLRRRGLTVRMSLGEDPRTMAAGMTGTRLDAVFLSATIAESVPFLVETAAAIRASSPTPPPLVLGGALVSDPACGGASSDPSTAAGDGTSAAFAGIDHVTSDLREAMRLCGLTAAG